MSGRMSPRSAALGSLQMLSRFGLWHDPLVSWMTREWRMDPDAGGFGVWKGWFDGIPVRLWTGDADAGRRSVNGRYRLAFGLVPAGHGLRFVRTPPGAFTPGPGWLGQLHPGNRPVRIGAGFSLVSSIDPADPVLDRIAEYSAIVRRFTDSVEDVALSVEGVRVEITSSSANARTLAHDAARAADLLRIAANTVPQ